MRAAGTLGCLLLFAVSTGAAERPTAAARNAREIDRLLAQQRTGKLVLIDDMWIPRERLLSYRRSLTRAGGVMRAAAATGTTSLWSGGRVYYTFNANVSAIHQRAFTDATGEWAACANLTFIPRTAEANYVVVNDAGASFVGGQSAVGMIGGAQTINIGSSAWNRATLVHELGHALGFIHEHQRPDRDSYVTILTANIQSGKEGNFTLLSGANQLRPYDFSSVMHYSRTAWSVDATTKDTVEPLPAYSQYLNVIGALYPRILSPSDRASIVQLYGPPVIPPSAVVSNTLDSGSGSLRAAIYYAADNPGTTIVFQIPLSDPGYSGGVFTIHPTDRLPGLPDNTTLDGTTQIAFTGNTNPSGPEVVISGQLNPASDVVYEGVILAGANCVVKGVVVNGFPATGVPIRDGAHGNVVRGCYIGTDATGATAVPNGYSGVGIWNGASGNTVGGTSPGDRNVLSGNTQSGVIIDSAANANVVLGNYIGVNATGTAALPNVQRGIFLTGGAFGNTIGGTVAGAGNLISGNTYQGVAIYGTGTNGNFVQGNYVGTNPTGTAALPNQLGGVIIYTGPQGNVIGGSGAGNVISGNLSHGILIRDSGTTNNTVQGNFIGLNATGTSAIGNNGSGVYVFNGATSTVVGPGNLIAGNSANGITILTAGTTGTWVKGNWIGVGVTGASLANTFSGVLVYSGATSTLIGGAPGSRNVISGNTLSGIRISDSGTNSTTIKGNLIGLNPVTGAAVANLSTGITVWSGPQGTQIGGTTPGDANIVQGNVSDGIFVRDSTTKFTNIRGNSIYNNSGLGINLANSANESQSPPTLTSAVAGNGLSVTGSLAGTANTAYVLDFYASPTADSSGFGEGRTFLGTLSVSTNASGSASFTFSNAAALVAGSIVSATATNVNGSTSSFSSDRIVTMTDSDGDGIPDAWETAHGLNPLVKDAALDSDGDGMTNLQEYFAGTNPLDGASRLSTSMTLGTSGDISIDLHTILGKTYRIEKRRDFSPTSLWLPWVESISGTGGTVHIVDPGAAWLSSAGYYRAVVVPD